MHRPGRSVSRRALLASGLALSGGCVGRPVLGTEPGFEKRVRVEDVTGGPSWGSVSATVVDETIVPEETG